MYVITGGGVLWGFNNPHVMHYYYYLINLNILSRGEREARVHFCNCFIPEFVPELRTSGRQKVGVQRPYSHSVFGQFIWQLPCMAEVKSLLKYFCEMGVHAK